MTVATHIINWGMNDARLYQRAVELRAIDYCASVRMGSTRALVWVQDTYDRGRQAGDLPRCTMPDLLEAAKEFVEYKIEDLT